ncbi:MFS transporter [Agromyces mediolanus]|uniref:MFS transporter n=1 Tax=Agromyces mediolanus TaxID=41986 RepID=UPI0020411C49|nr:MFS transporter [Agromyces mediolanus]MCM3657214.1 MFS transporter [Agromyces mediolanus]
MAERRAGVGAPLAAGALVVGIGLSVRSPITSVSALLPELERDFGLGAIGTAWLSTIPVLLFGLAAPLAPPLARRLGADRAAALLLTALAAAMLLRPFGAAPLLAGTVVVGASISLLGILTPQLVRTHLGRRHGLWSGVYTAAFGASAALGASLAVPILGAVGDDAGIAVGLWGLPVAAAAVLACTVAPRLTRAASTAPETGTAGRTGSILRAPRMWSVTGFFASQALIYFAFTAWLPTIAIDRGLAPSQAGLLLAWMSIAGIPAALLAPTIAAGFRTQSGVIAVVSCGSVLAILGLALAPITLAPVFVGVLGVAQSAAFGLAVGLIVARAPDIARTSAFSAVAQGVGYAVAALGPLLLGTLTSAGVPWTPVIAGLVLVAVAQLAFGIVAGRPAPRVPAGPAPATTPTTDSATTRRSTT